MGKVAFLFPGQGAQYIGMGVELCKQFPIAERIYNEASYILDFDLRGLCEFGSDEKLSKTEYAQPSIFTASYALFKVLSISCNIIPSFMAGHSLGEYSALACSGAICFDDALRLVRKRGEIMQRVADEGDSCMAAVIGLTPLRIAQECDKITKPGFLVVPSNINTPNQVVVSGHKQAIEKINERLIEIGAKVFPLKVNAAFHSPLMKKVSDEFENIVKEINFNNPAVPIISNVKGTILEDAESIKNELVEQFVSPVQWVLTIKNMEKYGVETFIDVGPGKVIKGLVDKNAIGKETYAFDMVEDKKELCLKYPFSHECIISKNNFITRCLAHAVCTPNKNFNIEEYKRGVIEPYRKLEKLQMEIEEIKIEPTKEHIKEAYNLLLQIFETKKVLKKDRLKRIQQLENETYTKHYNLNKEEVDYAYAN